MKKTSHSTYLNEVTSALVGRARRVPQDKLDYLQRYAGTNYRFLAISLPEQRALFKSGYSFGAETFESQFDIWETIWMESDCHQVMSQALFWLTIQSKKKNAETLWPRVKRWSARIENWAHADTLSAIYAQLHELVPEKVYPTLHVWNTSRNPWLRRLSLVSIFEYASKRKRQPAYAKVIALITPCLNDTDIFVQKAVGWTLRECHNVYPEKTQSFVLKHLHELTGIAFASATEKYLRALRTKLVTARKQYRSKLTSAK